MSSLCIFQHNLFKVRLFFFSSLESAVTNCTFKQKKLFSLAKQCDPIFQHCPHQLYASHILPFSSYQQNLAVCVSMKQSIYLTNHKTIFCDVKKLWTLPVCQSIYMYMHNKSSNKNMRAWDKNLKKKIQMQPT